MDTVKQTFSRNKTLKSLVRNDTVIRRGKFLIHVKAGSEKRDLARIMTAYRSYNYGEKYSFTDIAVAAEVSEEFVRQAFEFNAELKKLTKFDDVLPDGGICKNPEKEELVKAMAYVEKIYRETPLLSKYSASTIAADTGIKRTVVSEILCMPYMKQLMSADKKMSGGLFRKQSPEAQQLSLF